MRQGLGDSQTRSEANPADRLCVLLAAHVIPLGHSCQMLVFYSGSIIAMSKRHTPRTLTMPFREAEPWEIYQWRQKCAVAVVAVSKPSQVNPRE
jgi:hypothetical protein